VEVGWDPRYAADIRDFLKVHAFDYVLGALHAVDGLDVGPALFEGRTVSEASALYLNAATVAVKTGLFDALAHIDLPKRYGLAHYRQGWDAQACRAETEALFEAMVETGTVLEVNTSGLRQAPKETLPGPEALEWYRALGGRRVVLGSDAHTCGHLGHGFAETAAALKALGLEVLGAPPGRSRP
jgi:histidinol-phosphatase (PHP family)